MARALDATLRLLTARNARAKRLIRDILMAVHGPMLPSQGNGGRAPSIDLSATS